MNITFKNVGQGDSIVLEWDKKSQKKYGIIDCHIHQNNNPILDLIKNRKIQTIEFLLLSHPHFDHYSGFKRVLEYCYEKDIKIKYFLHSCSHVPDYLMTAVRSKEAEKSLQDLFLYIRKLRDEGVLQIGEVTAGVPFSSISLNELIKLNILSPTSKEKDSYILDTHLHNPEEDYRNNANANILSTIVLLTNGKKYVLLTSDAEKKSLIRIDKHEREHLQNVLELGQSPHHGAFHSHNNTFWRKRNRIDHSPIVFSVGKNSYGHPHNDVVQFFISQNYIPFSTNKVGGISVQGETQKSRPVSTNLDLVSHQIKIPGNESSGEITFNVLTE